MRAATRNRSTIIAASHARKDEQTQKQDKPMPHLIRHSQDRPDRLDIWRHDLALDGSVKPLTPGLTGTSSHVRLRWLIPDSVI